MGELFVRGSVRRPSVSFGASVASSSDSHPRSRRVTAAHAATSTVRGSWTRGNDGAVAGRTGDATRRAPSGPTARTRTSAGPTCARRRRRPRPPRRGQGYRPATSATEQVVDERPRRSAQPGVHRDAEALLCARRRRRPRRCDAPAHAGAAWSSPPRDTLNDRGSRSAKSARSGSRNGDRTSSPCAMLIRSDLAQDVVRQVLADIRRLQLPQGRPAGKAVTDGQPRQRRGRRVRARRVVDTSRRGLVRQPGAVPGEMRDRRRQVDARAGTGGACKMVETFRSLVGSRACRSRRASAAPSIGSRDVSAS